MLSGLNMAESGSLARLSTRTSPGTDGEKDTGWINVDDCKVEICGCGIWMVLPWSDGSSLGFLRDVAAVEEVTRGLAGARFLFSGSGAFGSFFFRGLLILTSGCGVGRALP